MAFFSKLALVIFIAIVTAASTGSQPSQIAAPQTLEEETTVSSAPAIVASAATMPAATATAFPTATVPAATATTVSTVTTSIPIPTITPTAQPKAATVNVEGAPDSSKFSKLQDTEHFTFYAVMDSYAQRNMDGFVDDAESLLAEMSAILDEKMAKQVSFYLYDSNQGYFSALSFAGPSLVYQQFGPKSGRYRTKAVTAHELVHHITFQTLGYPENLVHLEGLAHWASEPYWIRAEGRSFDDRVRRRLAAEVFFPLADVTRNRDLWKGDTQATVYDESASFVGYLIETYGLDKFKRVYMKSNYGEVYGRSLAELESDWLVDLAANQHG